MDILYYDGRCPLCAREIGVLRNLQRGGLAFADIHQPLSDGALPGREALLRRLHLRTESGAWVTGLEATVRAWSHTRLGLLFRPLLWPGIHQLARLVYNRWADRRYQRRYGCGACRE